MGKLRQAVVFALSIGSGGSLAEECALGDVGQVSDAMRAAWLGHPQDHARFHCYAACIPGEHRSADWQVLVRLHRGVGLRLACLLCDWPSGSIASLAANENRLDSGFRASGRIGSELGYGPGMGGGWFTGTPNLGFGLSGAGARDYRIGWRLTSVVRGDPGFEVTLDATRSEPANDNGSATPVEHGVMLRAGIG